MRERDTWGRIYIAGASGACHSAGRVIQRYHRRTYIAASMTRHNQSSVKTAELLALKASPSCNMMEIKPPWYVDVRSYRCAAHA